MRILVVEDEISVAEGVRRSLKADGFDVVVVHDGADGLVRARMGGFDLIVLDVMLPSLHGYRICQALRRADDQTPILILTAKAGEYEEAEGLELGADDFLAKPFSMIVLIARIHALLRRPRRRVDWPAVGDLRLDPVRRVCYRGGIPVPLTARELEVLAYLLDHSGTVVTKVELLGAVWGSTFEGDPNIVEVYVSHLRRKMNVPLGATTIVTVRGEGYCLEVGQPC
jgi:two-component system, OmpR family, response regulator